MCHFLNRLRVFEKNVVDRERWLRVRALGRTEKRREEQSRVKRQPTAQNHDNDRTGSPSLQIDVKIVISALDLRSRATRFAARRWFPSLSELSFTKRRHGVHPNPAIRPLFSSLGNLATPSRCFFLLKQVRYFIRFDAEGYFR